ncbi:sulfotransferase [Rhodanobacter sp. Si-c]|uniref:Sulfotransferase n=1 Tax=Rhodanobacter lycopersici TaxID=3162487 RepID=A0ABV3QDY8_9GAMM
MPPQPTLSPATRRLLADAGAALNQRQPDLAERLLAQVLAAEPDLFDAQFLYGLACLMRGDSARAAGFLRKAAGQRPGDANIQMYLGCALQDAGVPDEALVHLRRACEMAPGQASPWYNLGKALKQQAWLDDAAEALRRALALDDRHVLARICLADICTMQGDIARAVAEYRRVLRQQPDQAKAWHALANLKTEPLNHEDIGQIRLALRNPGISSETRTELGFSLFRALEDQHDYAGAFAALREANAEMRRQVGWDAAAERARIDAIMETFRLPLPAPLDPALGREAILIVSLPRSGSTLVEHILASHPQVEGANEIPDLSQVIEDESRRRGQPFPQWVATATAQDWWRLGKDYLARTARWREKRPRFSDKSLLNWPLVGAALAMLPGAKIIDCHRDPLETCFACYRQLFRHSMHFSYDLDDMADHYRDYRRVIDFWQSRYPGRVLDFSYEALLQEPEIQIRHLLAFCDLPFDPACLTPHQTKREVLSTASAAQVREPIRADTAHSAPYLEWLQRLRERLVH